MIGPGLPGFNFNRASIIANAPTVSGVYAIYNYDNYIYFGEGKDIQARLIDHLSGDNACILRHQPTGFAFEAVGALLRVSRQDALILQLRPLCNQRLG